jgi:hypothetical protein
LTIMQKYAIITISRASSGHEFIAGSRIRRNIGVFANL